MSSNSPSDSKENKSFPILTPEPSPGTSPQNKMDIEAAMKTNTTTNPEASTEWMRLKMKMKMQELADATDDEDLMKMKMKQKMKLKMTADQKLSAQEIKALKMKLKSQPANDKLKMKMEQMKLFPDKEHMKHKMNMKMKADSGELFATVSDDQKMKMTVESHERAVPISLSKSHAKPPNVLVYAEDAITRNSMLVLLRFILAKDRYTLYPLTPQDAKSSVWGDNTTLLVVCGDVNLETSRIILDFFFAGGNMLCLCSNLLAQVVPSLQNSSVQNYQPIDISFGKWKNLQVLHRCYSNFKVDDLREGVEMQVLATTSDLSAPNLLLVKDKNKQGIALFSQIHLETNPLLFKHDVQRFNGLKAFELTRMEVLSELLAKHLEISVSADDLRVAKIEYKNAHLVGSDELKSKFLGNLTSRLSGSGVFETPKHSIQFCRMSDQPPAPSKSVLPIMIDQDPDVFSIAEYFKALHTKQIGRLIIYAPILTSSTHIVAHLPLLHGMAVIVRQQSEGTGRSNNQWLSPKGCAMFSMQLHIPLASGLGQRITLVQHLVAVAIVHGILSIPGYETLNIRLKWPNDIYANGTTKIGGLMINTSIESTKAILNVGCGVNLSNSTPTTCVNDLIRQQSTTLAPLTDEQYFGTIFTAIEELLDRVQGGDFDGLYKLYYTYWLHGKTSVRIHDKDGSEQTAKVLGIDKLGYLMVQTRDRIESVHPDGNSFDMLRGLIVPKTT